ncbi:hypothetical protein FPOAC2_06711 [Fusarium poae]|jgi:hypothetical protein
MHSSEHPIVTQGEPADRQMIKASMIDFLRHYFGHGSMENETVCQLCSARKELLRCTTRQGWAPYAHRPENDIRSSRFLDSGPHPQSKNSWTKHPQCQGGEQSIPTVTLHQRNMTRNAVTGKDRGSIHFGHRMGSLLTSHSSKKP